MMMISLILNEDASLRKLNFTQSNIVSVGLPDRELLIDPLILLMISK